MSRTYKQPSLVSGLSINDITNMDVNTFNSLNESDLRKVVGRLVSAGNKRIRNFEKTGTVSPAIRYIQESGGKFSTRGKNLNQLRAEYARAKGFLQAKTSTKRGYNQVKKETAQKLKQKGIDVKPGQLETVFQNYEKLKESNPEVANKQLKYQVLLEINEMVEDNPPDMDRIQNELQNKLESIYQQEQDLIMGDGHGVSEFFTIE